MVISEIQSYLENIERDVTLQEEKNFESRTEVIDYIEFHIIDRIEGLLQKANPAQELFLLKERANKVMLQLEKINADLFQQLRTKIKTGDYTGSAFKQLVNEYINTNLNSKGEQGEIGYDNLDVFINGLFSTEAVPDETKEREPEMVYYQKTPARIIFDLVEKIHITDKDVFYDIGSGLGQVSILVHLLSGATSRGVEFEPSYCYYATVSAAALNLSRIEFINQDARVANYSDGTFFFMYPPFKGSMLEEMVQVLAKESKKRPITLLTYGPCTLQVMDQSWLSRVSADGNNIYELAVFKSFVQSEPPSETQRDQC